ncbi:MAG: aminoglycoside phosphotransferase family protein [Actinomycetota bacterium]
MCAGKMHADEVHTDVTLVRGLLTTQFPQWAELRIEPVVSSGTDNALYRLGDDMVVRLPRIHWAVEMVDKEHEWLPTLAPHLPLSIPVPLAKGMPGEGYPWHWSVNPWFEGNDTTVEPIADLRRAALELAEFIADLQRIDPSGGPFPGTHNVFRGVPLAARDAQTRKAIDELVGVIDTGAAIAVWESALQAPVWERPLWIHGDIDPRNLLVQRGHLRAVIDWGCLGVGDPAYDLTAAWRLFSGESRDAFRSALAFDDATWARARGLVVSMAAGLAYYTDTNPALVSMVRRGIDEVLTEHKRDA